MPTLSRVVALTTILALAVTPAIGKGFRFKGVTQRVVATEGDDGDAEADEYQEPTTRFVTGRVSHQWEDEARRAAVAARLRTEKDALDRRGGTGSGSGKDSGGDSGSDSGSGGGRFSGGAGEAKAADDGDDDHDDHDEEIDGGGVFSSGGGIDGWAAPPLSSAGVQRPGCGTVGPPPGQPWAKRAVASGALGEPAPFGPPGQTLAVGAARRCAKLYLWGIQGSGSTFAWQVLKAVVARAGLVPPTGDGNATAALRSSAGAATGFVASNRRPTDPAGASAGATDASTASAGASAGASSRASSLPLPLEVVKGHYLNRMIRDHGLDQGVAMGSSAAAATGGESGKGSGVACLVATYRDFRDVLCSHARRGGMGGVKACSPGKCDAGTLAESKAVVTTLGKLFGKGGGQAAELKDLQRRGAVLLRYESFVGCPLLLIDTFAAWLGVAADLKRGGPPTQQQQRRHAEAAPRAEANGDVLGGGGGGGKWAKDGRRRARRAGGSSLGRQAASSGGGDVDGATNDGGGGSSGSSSSSGGGGGGGGGGGATSSGASSSDAGSTVSSSHGASGDDYGWSAQHREHGVAGRIDVADAGRRRRRLAAASGGRGGLSAGGGSGSGGLREGYHAWRRRIAAETSVAANAELAGKLKVFSKYDKETGIHGGHISNGGAVGGWKACMTPAVRAHVHVSLGPFLAHFNYSAD